MDKLNDLVKKETNKTATLDIINIEQNGVKIYTTQYNGYAWAYSQGYELPITGGAKVRLVSKSIYSDFSGMAFDKRVRKNLGAFADEILNTVTRGLNQGISYQKLATEITKATDRQYKNALVVARTEGGRIQSDAYLDSLALLDDVGATYEKLWHAAIDDKTRKVHQEMDGQKADKDGVFHLPSGSTGPAPRKTGVAKDDIQCRCSALTIINGENPKQRRIRGEGIVPYETYTQRLERGGEIPMRDIKKK
jgi:SPP1 gp7 family putative phage head morphogenesis protein